MDNKTFAERLGRLRTEKGLTARALSIRLGKNYSYINRIENGKAYPRMQEFFRICEILEISPKVFFSEEIDNPYAYDMLVGYFTQLNKDKQTVLVSLAKELRSNR